MIGKNSRGNSIYLHKLVIKYLEIMKSKYLILSIIILLVFSCKTEEKESSRRKDELH